MQDRVTYEYAIIRFVPKVEREEFINVGALVFCKRKKYLGIKYTIHQQKIESLSKDADVALLHEYLKAWELVCLGDSKSGVIGALELSDRFRWLSASKSTILQCSMPHPGMCINPEEELEDLFNKYVLA